MLQRAAREPRSRFLSNQEALQYTSISCFGHPFLTPSTINRTSVTTARHAAPACCLADTLTHTCTD